MSRKTVTLKDLAQILGLHGSSVSLALRDSPKISPQTRRRVQEVARQYHYQSHPYAKSLATGQSQVVGILMSATHLEEVAETVPSRTLHFISEILASLGYSCQIVPSAPEEMLSWLQHMSGVIAWGNIEASAVRLLKSEDVPFVVIDPVEESLAGLDFPCIRQDNEGGIALIFDLIQRHGFRKVHFLIDDPHHLGKHERQTAFERLIRMHCDYERCHAISLSPDLPETEYARRLLEDLPQAYIACNDLAALRAMGVLLSHKVRVPGDVKIAGFDDIDAGRIIYPSLTTIGWDYEAAARTAVEVALGMPVTVGVASASLVTGKKDTQQITIPVRLIERQSM